MTTIPATPTLPASWQPTVAGCLSTGDFWHSYGFECVNSIPAEYHGSQFRCMSAWATSGAVLVTHTNFVANTLAVETIAARASRPLFALAVTYVASTSEPSATPSKGSNDLTTTSPPTETTSQSSSPTSQSASEQSSSNTGIGTGASAGIGVGAAAGVVLLAVVAWWLYHRRTSRKQVSRLSTDHSPYAPEIDVQEAPNNGHESPKAVPPTRSELSSSFPVAQELPASPQ
ncbi:uncharacterized protein LA080_010109 [Diaporthe eres]|nr:uncharacterized protein LA080_010109 [Diaporthe eres]